MAWRVHFPAHPHGVISTSPRSLSWRWHDSWLPRSKQSEREGDGERENDHRKSFRLLWPQPQITNHLFCLVVLSRTEWPVPAILRLRKENEASLFFFWILRLPVLMVTITRWSACERTTWLGASSEGKESFYREANSRENKTGSHIGSHRRTRGWFEDRSSELDPFPGFCVCPAFLTQGQHFLHNIPPIVPRECK